MRTRSVARLFRRPVIPRAKIRRAVTAYLKPAATGSAAAFGSNPGALRMRVYAPPKLPAGRPLIVVLHGCGQTATAFAAGAGWIALADEQGFALLLPEQTRENNGGGCFNWFRSEDTRIFVVGFSAGGGMAAALLAAYPAVFAAGGVIAGMPVHTRSLEERHRPCVAPVQPKRVEGQTCLGAGRVGRRRRHRDGATAFAQRPRLSGRPHARPARGLHSGQGWRVR